MKKNIMLREIGIVISIFLYFSNSSVAKELVDKGPDNPATIKKAVKAVKLLGYDHGAIPVKGEVLDIISDKNGHTLKNRSTLRSKKYKTIKI